MHVVYCDRPTPAPDSHDTRFRRIERRALATAPSAELNRAVRLAPVKDRRSCRCDVTTSPGAHMRDREVEVTFSCTHFPFVILWTSNIWGARFTTLIPTSHTTCCNYLKRSTFENNLSIQISTEKQLQATELPSSCKPSPTRESMISLTVRARRIMLANV